MEREIANRFEDEGNAPATFRFYLSRKEENGQCDSQDYLWPSYSF
jgi:hypothetical protein